MLQSTADFKKIENFSTMQRWLSTIMDFIKLS